MDSVGVEVMLSERIEQEVKRPVDTQDVNLLNKVGIYLALPRQLATIGEHPLPVDLVFRGCVVQVHNGVDLFQAELVVALLQNSL